MSKLRVLGVCFALLAMGAAFGALRHGVWGLRSNAHVFHEVRHAANEASGAQDDFEWTGRVSRGDFVEIKGVNGPISAVRAAGESVRVEAVKRARRSDPDEVTIEVVEHRDGVTICAVYPSRNGANTCEPGSEGRNSTRNNDVVVSFEVQVPEGVTFVGRTVNGEVEAVGLEGPIEVSTVNGDVEVETTYGASARTVNGSIFAVLGDSWTGDVEMETVNGSIEIDVPDGGGAEVDASWVNGSLEVDMPLRLEGKMNRRSARGVIGAGGPELDVSTVNGSIRVH